MDDLDILENSVNLENIEEEDIQEKKPIQRRKRTPTPKQLEVLEKAREKMLTNAREKRIKKQLEDEAIEKEIQRRVNEYKKGVEEKIVRKAVAIKKREIMRQAEIDEIEDDDIPMEKVVEAIKKPKQQKQGAMPPYDPPIKETQPTPSPPVKKYIFV
jgi:hypothetical protein